ncbi:MAG: MarR family transcriptional regulator [Clostridia bacterium]|nr:MarR family transcriptional regulator [Clostridia bacterium]
MRRRYIAAKLSPYGLRGSMPNLLLMLERHPGRLQDEAATRLALDKGNATRMLGTLEELSYIRRETYPLDRRRNCLYLTEKGQQLIPQIHRVFDEWNESICSEMTQAERDNAMALIQKLFEGAQKNVEN